MTKLTGGNRCGGLAEPYVPLIPPSMHSGQPWSLASTAHAVPVQSIAEDESVSSSKCTTKPYTDGGDLYMYTISENSKLL